MVPTVCQHCGSSAVVERGDGRRCLMCAREVEQAAYEASRRDGWHKPRKVGKVGKVGKWDYEVASGRRSS